MEDVTSVKATPVRDQLRSGYDAVAGQVGHTVRTVKEEAGQAARVIRSEVEAQVADGIEHVRGAAAGSVQRWQESARGAADAARSQVQANPEKWLLIAMGAGVLLGACAQMLGARRAMEPRY